MIIVSKMASHCAGTVQMSEESASGIRKWEEMWYKTTAEDGERGGSSDVQWKTVPQMSDCNRKHCVADSGQPHIKQTSTHHETQRRHAQNLCIHSGITSIWTDQPIYIHSFIHSFISGMHHYGCIVPKVDINLQSGWFWATSLASFRERFIDFSLRSCWVVFIHVVQLLVHDFNNNSNLSNNKFCFNMTDSMLLGCVTVLLHVLLLLYTFLLFTFFYYSVCFYVLWAYAWNKDGLD